MNRPTVTGIVLARDEEANIRACLESLAWTDEKLVVLDPRTADKTADIARSLGAKIVERVFSTFPAQRNFALDQAQTDWVFFVDADERIPKSLADEILSRLRCDYPGESARRAGYWVPRRNIIWNRWIRGGGWYPDYQLRLLEVARSRYDEAREVHELVILDGEAGHLDEPLVHYNYRTVGLFLRKQEQYSTLDATTLYRQGVRPKPQNYVLQPLREFKRRYFDNSGFRDGPHGMLLALLLGWYNYRMYVKLARLWQGPGEGVSD